MPLSYSSRNGTGCRSWLVQMPAPSGRTCCPYSAAQRRADHHSSSQAGRVRLAAGGEQAGEDAVGADAVGEVLAEGEVAGGVPPPADLLDGEAEFGGGDMDADGAE